MLDNEPAVSVNDSYAEGLLALADMMEAAPTLVWTGTPNVLRDTAALIKQLDSQVAILIKNSCVCN